MLESAVVWMIAHDIYAPRLLPLRTAVLGAILRGTIWYWYTVRLAIRGEGKRANL